MRAVAVLREARAGPEGLVTGHATNRAGRLLTLHRALYDAVLVNVKRAGRRAPEDLGVQAVAGGQSGVLRADLSELRGGHAEFEEPLAAPRLAGGLAGTFGWLCRLAVGLAEFSRAFRAGLRAGLRVWGWRRGRAGRGVAPAGRHLGGRGRVALCGRRAPHLVERGVSAGLRVLAGHCLDLRCGLLCGHLGLGRRACLRAGRVNAGACGGFGWRAGCRREGPRTSAEGRELLAWLRCKGLVEVGTLAMSTRPSESACRRLRICSGLSSRTCSLSVLAGWLSKNCQALAAMMSQGERLRGSASVQGEVYEAACEEARFIVGGMRVGVAVKTRAGL